MSVASALPPLHRSLFAALVLAATLPVAAAAAPSAAAPAAANAAPVAPAPSPAESSYNLGLLMGGQIAHAGLSQELAMDAFLRGLREALAAKLPTVAQREDAARFMRAGREAYAERNRAAAAEFLVRNEKDPHVTTTASGLQYQVLVAGDSGGKAPGPKDAVTIQYRASLADGNEFDSSYAHGQPATFRMNSVIKGWAEALSLMRPGSKWRVWVPPALGYDLYAPPPIPPGALIVYELELLNVDRAPVPAATPSGAPHGPTTKNAAGASHPGAAPPH
ncbi:MAG TPA: FKBP-type peptidyl-prolyl cis-trans isomerase [Steroidobacteraceae bacterium]|nr:FKBP-type peptidyl-prolyl cis-trans isomerase [Steroidobacteraceae bacterium]